MDIEESRAAVLLLPIEEPVEFAQAGQSVVVSARTSSAGPGYHAYLVDQLDELAGRANLIVAENNEYLDETGYFSSRDFGQLQNEMEANCQAQARLVRQYSDAGAAGILLSLRIDNAPIGIEGLALTSRGPRDAQFFQGEELGPNFFPWWEQGMTANSAFGLSQALLWTEYPWRKSQDGDEEHLEAAIAKLLQQADGLAAQSIEAEFSKARTALNAPSRSGPGYRRYEYNRPLGGGWTLRVPGYFCQSFNEGDSTFWFDDREVHATAFSVTTVEDKLIDPFEKDDLELVGSQDGLIYKARSDPYESDGFNGYKLWGGAYGRTGFALVTILFAAASDAEWAHNTLRSLAQSKPTG